MSPVDPRAPAAAIEPHEAVKYRWYHKAFALLFIVFCLEVGIVLLILPWSEYWDDNYFSGLTPAWRNLWENSFLRGAVSGVGIVNILISFGELFRLRRFRG